MFGCEEDPIFGLERGWLRTDKNSDENEGGDNNTSDVSYSIAIDKPNGGENWEIGDSEDIRWESDAPQGQMVGIQLFRNSNYLRIIASQTSNTGEFAWIIPSDLTNANDYRVRIFLYDYPQIEDFSNEYFSVTTSDVSYSIVIDKPNGGENWETGDTENIKWETDAPQSYMVGIQLFINSNYSSTISSQTNNAGEFAWTIPNDLTNTNDYKIRVYLYDYPQVEDFSDGFFTIELGDSGGDLPNYECNIIHETTGTTFTLINPSQNIYNFGDTYTVTLYSDTYNVGQQGGVILRLNENTVYNFGSWLVFDSNGQHDFTLPSESDNIYPSNCYTIVVIGYNQQDEYVSEPFTIY